MNIDPSNKIIDGVSAKRGTMKKSNEELDIGRYCWKLNNLSKEVRAIGELIKWQKRDVDFDHAVLFGIGEILERLGRRISKMARHLERRL